MTGSIVLRGREYPFRPIASSFETITLSSASESRANSFLAIRLLKQKASTTSQSEVSTPRRCIRCNTAERSRFCSRRNSSVLKPGCSISASIALHIASYSSFCISRREVVRPFVNCRMSVSLICSRSPCICRKAHKTGHNWSACFSWYDVFYKVLSTVFTSGDSAVKIRIRRCRAIRYSRVAPSLLGQPGSI